MKPYTPSFMFHIPRWRPPMVDHDALEMMESYRHHPEVVEVIDMQNHKVLGRMDIHDAVVKFA